MLMAIFQPKNGNETVSDYGEDVKNETYKGLKGKSRDVHFLQF